MVNNAGHEIEEEIIEQLRAEEEEQEYQEESSQMTELQRRAVAVAAAHGWRDNKGRQNALNNQPRRRSQQQPRQMPQLGRWDEYNVYQDDAGSNGATVLPPLPAGIKFDITSSMTQMLSKRELFAGKANDETNMHQSNFLKVCKSNSNRLVVSHNAITLPIFPLPSIGEETLWLYELPNNSIITWREL